MRKLITRLAAFIAGFGLMAALILIVNFFTGFPASAISKIEDTAEYQLEKLNQIAAQLASDVRSLTGQDQLGGVSLDVYRLSDAAATTTPHFQGTGAASTTLTMSVTNAKHIDLNIWAKSTSTIPVITWTWYFSSDDGANKNWYPEDGNTVTSNTLVTHGASPLTHSWTPVATSTVGETWLKNAAVDPVASKYAKVMIDATGAATDLYVEGVTQADPNQ